MSQENALCCDDRPQTVASAEFQSPLTASVAPGPGCPPPLRCRDIAAALDAEASPWELPDSVLGTRGWCWGQGPSLYFLNGSAASARLYSLLAWLLRDQYRCMLMDWQPRRDCGRPSLDQFADDLIRVADAAGDDEFAIYGGPFGGAIGLRVAAQTPGRVHRLVLQGVARRRRLGLGERCLAPLARRSRLHVAQLPYRQSIQALNHRRWFPPLDPDRWNWFLETTGDLPLALLTMQAEALQRTNLADDLLRVRCPVLLIDTEGAGLAAAVEQAAICARLADARTAPLHTTGWHPYLTHPHRLMKLITPFLADPVAFDAAPAEPPFFNLKPQ